MDLTKNSDGQGGGRRPRRRWGFLPRWLEVLAICAATLLAAFFGGRVTVVADDSPQPAVTVTVTADPEPGTRAESPTAAPETDSPMGGTPDSSPPPGSGGGEAQAFLADLDPVQGGAVVDPLTVQGQHFAKSVRLKCDRNGDSVVYTTSGYSRLTAKAAIRADSSNAIGAIGSLKIIDASGRQIGDSHTIRSSQITEIDVDITGQDQIAITCVMTKSGTGGYSSFFSGLGDALLSASDSAS